MNNSDKHSKIQRVLLKVCAVLCAIILTINPIETNAMNPVLPIPPIWLPINPYNTESIVPNAELLNDEQKNILYDIIGAYNHIYLGFGGFVLTNPVQGVRQWWNEYGETFYNSFVQSVVGSPRALIDMVGSATYKASQYETEQEFLNEISDTNSANYVQYNPELTIAFRDWYFNRGGVYQWQFSDKPFETEYTWIGGNMGGYATSYESYVEAMSKPHVKCNINVTEYGNCTLGNFSVDNLVLFINTTTGEYTVCTLDSGHESSYTADGVNTRYYEGSGNVYRVETFSLRGFSVHGYTSLSGYNTLVEAVKALYINPVNVSVTKSNGTSWQLKMPLANIAPRCFVGTSWSDAHEIFNIDDMNISSSDSAYIDNVGNDAFTDINGLYASLGADVVNIQEGVFDNTLVETEDGTGVEQLTRALTEAIDKFQTTPNSGIVIPTGIFAPVKGFMDYMWYMTKPLIVFTKNILETLTFGAADGFLNTGPAIFIYGVVAFGLIGGLVVKCLL